MSGTAVYLRGRCDNLHLALQEHQELVQMEVMICLQWAGVVIAFSVMLYYSVLLWCSVFCPLSSEPERLP
jgi:hypothetical protein